MVLASAGIELANNKAKTEHTRIFVKFAVMWEAYVPGDAKVNRAATKGRAGRMNGSLGPFGNRDHFSVPP